MHTAIEIGAEVAKVAVSVEPCTAGDPSYSWERCIRISSPRGKSATGWHGSSEHAADGIAEHLQTIVAGIVAHAIERDREHRCAGCEAEKRELRKRLHDLECGMGCCGGDPVLAPGARSMPSSANSAGSAVKKSSGGGA